MKTKVVVIALSVLGSVMFFLSNAFANPDPEVPLPVSKRQALQLNVPVDIEKGARIFAGCSGCHDAGPSAINRIGPKLNALIGRKAGSVEGYGYSKALLKAGKNGLVWTPYKLDAFLMAPNVFLSGNKMPFKGIKDVIARRDLIGYLKTLN